MLRLVIEDRSGAIRQHPLVQGQRLRLGRADDNDVVLPWQEVSQKHASVEVECDSLWLEDLGSRNGLVLNERRCDRLRLKPGMEVWIGSLRLFVEEIAGADAEVALPMARGGTLNIPSRGSETADAPPGRNTPASALAWIRAWQPPIDQRDRRKALLSAADVLGASGLAITAFRRGQLVIEDLVGFVAPALIEKLAAWESSPSRVTPDAAWEVFDETGQRCAAAQFPVDRSLEPWQRDFLVVMGRVLATPAISQSGPRDPVGAEPELEPSVDGLSLPPGMVLGKSPAVQQVFDQVRRAAPSELSIVLLGPTGVGKELFARMIHRSSLRSHAPFVPVLTPTLPTDLTESELFGIERGVATNVEQRPGLATQAEGGTLFLDEIGDLPLDLQAKLLRMLEEKEVWPVGARQSVPIDVRIVAATHRNLKHMVSEGSFREDLYYRLAGLCLYIPSLAERPEDIPEMAVSFLRESAGDKRLPGVSAGAIELLRTRAWRGNVRELRDAVRRAAVLARDGEILDSRFFADLPPRTDSRNEETAIVQAQSPVRAAQPTGVALQDQLRVVERRALIDALECHGGNRSQAAKSLGLSRGGLRKKLERHGIDPRRFESH